MKVSPSRLVPQKLTPYLKLYRHRRTAKRQALEAFQATDGPPILVYQMAKVGSTTVQKSLQAAGFGHRVLHLHFLSEDLPAKRAHYIRSTQFPPAYHYELSRAVRKALAKQSVARVKIISLVRDPIARLVSSIYQVPDLMGAHVKTEHGTIDPHKVARWVRTKLHGPGALQYVNTWFDREIKRVFHIDVFEHPFPKDRGWTILRNEGVELLLMRTEDLAEKGPTAMATLLGTDHPIEIKTARIRAATPHGHSYAKAIEKLALPHHLVERVYSSRVVRQFYSHDLIHSFVARWSDPKDPVLD